MYFFTAVVAFLILQIGCVLFGDYKKYKEKWAKDRLYMVLDSISTLIMMVICAQVTAGKSPLISLLFVFLIALIFACVSGFIRKFTNMIKERK